MRVPTVEHGIAFKNAPANVEAAAVRRAIPAWVCATDNTRSAIMLTNGESHDFWNVSCDESGGDNLHMFCQSATASLKNGSLVPAKTWRSTGKICVMSDAHPATDDRNAGNVTCVVALNT
jgi:hypothetical protein